MSAYRLYLDDVRDPPAGSPWVVARSISEFVALVEVLGVPSFVSFDHDLGARDDGACCARWLVELCIDCGEPVPGYAVHSLNPCGRDNIDSIMASGRKVSPRSAT